MINEHPSDDKRFHRHRSFSLSCIRPEQHNRELYPADRQKKMVPSSYVKDCDVKVLKFLDESHFLKGLCPFHIVIDDENSLRREPKVKYLIQAKADINELCKKKSGEYSTPLHLAVRLSQLLTTLFLLEANADINAVGNFRVSTIFGFCEKKKTALDLAKGDPVMCDFLSRRGGLTYREL